MKVVREMVDNFIEINLIEDDNFLKIKETLTRIGIASSSKKKLFQSCHILHKKGKYYIVHFKEMFRLDGKETIITEDDLARRNTIINLLSQWKLLTIVDEDKTVEVVPMNRIKIISFKEKRDWELESKYTIGNKRLIE